MVRYLQSTLRALLHESDFFGIHYLWFANLSAIKCDPKVCENAFRITWTENALAKFHPLFTWFPSQIVRKTLVIRNSSLSPFILPKNQFSCACIFFDFPQSVLHGLVVFPVTNTPVWRNFIQSTAQNHLVVRNTMCACIAKLKRFHLSYRLLWTALTGMKNENFVPNVERFLPRCRGKNLRN